MKDSALKPSCKLSAEATAWWKRLTVEFSIDDDAGLLLLETALVAYDRMRDAQRLIAKHGQVVNDRWGQLKPNPACVIERDSRAAMLQALKQLNLDLEPLRDRMGRPPGGGGR